MNACEKILRDVLLHEDSWPFAEAVNLREVGYQPALSKRVCVSIIPWGCYANNKLDRSLISVQCSSNEEENNSNLRFLKLIGRKNNTLWLLLFI